ncbi:hypothetical protein GCM10011349_20020 [Novosphingobium indicum]|uniref:Uncharacterized protein n=1 Tax=Novosphingobium indicum TaxID=462949 RepID=A0ABQ2JP51_9SPHN|nr:hypothetical protein [Novosphingobium indicum]GGN49422.1 hypothetical protein GCM10011349_20020 [Novosphingobium indicum]
MADATSILSMIPSALPGWIGAGAAAGGGFGIIKWVFEYVGGRMDKRADRLDEDTRFVIDNLRAEVERLKDERVEDARRLDDAFARIDEMRRELDDCNRKHAEAEARVKHLEAMQQGYGDARQRVQTERAAEIVEIRKDRS